MVSARAAPGGAPWGLGWNEGKHFPYEAPGGSWPACLSACIEPSAPESVPRVRICSDSRCLCVAGCSFPAEWEGQWFQLGQQGVSINGSTMHGKGHCVESDGDKYIMMDKSDGK